MVKVAVLLIGHLRTYSSTYLNMLNNLIHFYNCDVYLTTLKNGNLLNFTDQENLKKLYGKNLVSINVVDEEKFSEKYPSPSKTRQYKFDVNRMYNIEKLINYAYEKFKESSENDKLTYDVIVKIRPDLNLTGQFPDLKSLNITDSTKLYVPKSDSGNDFNDHLAFGCPAAMEIYLTYYKYFAETDTEKVDVSMIEHGLKTHLLKNNIDIERLDIQYRIFRPLKYSMRAVYKKKRLPHHGRL